MSKHTPGRWESDLREPFTLGGDCREVVALDDDGMVQRSICTFMLDTDEHPDGETFLEDVAIARLIAAAPELLTACEAACNVFAGQRRVCDEKEWKESYPREQNAWDALQAAIAKAMKQ